MKAIIPVTVLCLPLFHGSVGAKHPTRDGSEDRFWQMHTLVSGTIERVEQRFGKQFHVDLFVDDCAVGIIPADSRLEAEYTEPDDVSNPFAGLKRGDRVLVLVRPSFGRAIIPNGEGESFAMMPSGKALYRMATKDDPRGIETKRICRAIALPGLRERLQAISYFLTDNPSSEAKSFLREYVETLVRQTESDLKNAKMLSDQLKSNPAPK
jgi:hypothetical protein